MKLWIIVLVIPILLGCSQIRQMTLDASKEDLANAQTMRQIADNMTTRWSLYSGTIHCGLGAAYDESRLAPVCNSYDTKIKEMNKWIPQDYDRGCVLGLEARLGVKSAEDFLARIIQLISQYGYLF